MAKKIDESQVKKVAKLSRLDLSDNEITEFTTQLSAILEYVEKMNELDTDNVQPLAHCLPISNCFRDDTVKDSVRETVCGKVQPLGGRYGIVSEASAVAATMPSQKRRIARENLIAYNTVGRFQTVLAERFVHGDL